MRTPILAALLSSAVLIPIVAQSMAYVPTATSWETKRPDEVGMDSARLAAAVAFARASDNGWPTDVLENLKKTVAKEPYPEILGPVKDRAETNGIILRQGYIVAEWGNTRQVDMTFSVAKSYLATVAGLAYDRGLIKDLNAPEGQSIKDGRRVRQPAQRQDHLGHASHPGKRMGRHAVGQAGRRRPAVGL
jgi:hypothetical protein